MAIPAEHSIPCPSNGCGSRATITATRQRFPSGEGQERLSSHRQIDPIFKLAMLDSAATHSFRFAGPEGPHHCASVGRDTTPYSVLRRELSLLILHLTDRAHTTREGRQHRYRDNFLRSTVSTLRSAVMRRVFTRGQLECVCPWRLAPSEPGRTAGASVSAGREGSVAPPPPMRAHTLVSLSSTGTRPSWVMQALGERAKLRARRVGLTSASPVRSRFQPSTHALGRGLLLTVEVRKEKKEEQHTHQIGRRHAC